MRRPQQLGTRPVTERLERREMLAGDYVLLGDINTRPVDLEPLPLGVAGQFAYFRSKDPAHGAELWRTDGTVEGTQLVRDIRPGPQGSDPNEYTFLSGGDHAFFRAWNAQTNQPGLWATDGSADGTRLLSTTPPTDNSAAWYHDHLYYFTASGLWVTDGTVEGTKPWDGLGAGFQIARRGIQVFDDALLFVAYSDDLGYQLFRSDGTAAGTTPLAPLKPFLATLSTSVVGDSLYLFAETGSGTRLWKTDGTSIGTQEVTATDFELIQEVVAVGDKLFFTAGDGTFTMSLWVSDGTSSGTRQLSDLATYPTRLGSAGGLLLFDANAPGFGRELWVSDGTSAGTHLLKDVAPGTPDGISFNSPPGRSPHFSDKYFFAADDGSGSHLWKSDGTLEGTEIVSADTDGLSSWFYSLNGRLVFQGSYVDRGTELWVSDGTAAGTRAVTVNPLLTEGSLPSDFVQVGPHSFFTADDGIHGRELWVTDGTAVGTYLVKDINAGPSGSLAKTWLSRHRTVIGDTLYFFALDPEFGWEPWKSDGTAAGTVMLKDTLPGPQNTDSLGTGEFIKVGDQIFFAALGPQGARALWKTDGTSEGTSLVADNINPEQLTELSGKLYFVGWAGGIALMTSDGTADGTVVATPNIPATPEGGPLKAALNQLFFIGDSEASGNELWKSDGTTSGTHLVKNINPGPTDSNPVTFTELNGWVYFLATSAEGRGLWRTDGTAAGTTLIKNPPTSSPATVFSLARFGDTLVFRANNQLWKSDGTSEGTIPLLTGAELAVPGNPVAIGSDLYFLGDDGSGAVKLWRQSGMEPKSVIALPNGVVEPSGIGLANGQLVLIAGGLGAGGELFLASNSGYVPGDANGDSRIDLTDFGILKAHFGTGSTLAEGDFDGDGRVNLSDFGILKSNFGLSGTYSATVRMQSMAPAPSPAQQTSQATASPVHDVLLNDVAFALSWEYGLLWHGGESDNP